MKNKVLLTLIYVLILLIALMGCREKKDLEKELLQDSGNITETASTIENEILSKYLSSLQADGSYAVVKPGTHLNISEYRSAKEAEDFKNYIKSNFSSKGYDISELVDRLFELNIPPGLLTLKSSPSKGYYVDYDGRFTKYFADDGGGWKKLRSDYPHAGGFCYVSLPAYDPKTDYVLMYFGVQVDWLAGFGGIRLFKYNHGEFIEISQLQLWVS